MNQFKIRGKARDVGPSSLWALTTRRALWVILTIELSAQVSLCLQIHSPQQIHIHQRSRAATFPAPSLTSRRVLRSSQHDNAESTHEEATSTHSNPAQLSGVTLKIAVDAQGAAGEAYSVLPSAASTLPTPSVRFTSPASLDMVHRLRRDSDAVLVGRGTVVADDPSLTVRRNVTVHQQPLRVVLDPSLKLLRLTGNSPDAVTIIPPQYTLLRDGYPTVVYHCHKELPTDATAALSEAVNLVYMDPSSPTSNDRQLNLTDVLNHLQSHWNVHHLMVEGGPATAQCFLEHGLVDRALIVRAPRVCFSNPATAIHAGMESDRLRQAGLEYLGLVEADGDIIECWSRPGAAWPTERLKDWP